MEKKTIFSKLLLVQTELKSPKTERNDFGNFLYRKLEKIFADLKPLLSKHEVTIIFSEEIIEIGGESIIKSQVRFFDDNSEIISHAFSGIEKNHKKMNSSQIISSASSYARKKALEGLLLLDDSQDHDDPDFRKENNRSKQVNRELELSKKINMQKNSVFIKALKKLSKKEGVYELMEKLVKNTELVDITDFDSTEDYEKACNFAKKYLNLEISYESDVNSLIYYVMKNLDLK